MAVPTWHIAILVEEVENTFRILREAQDTGKWVLFSINEVANNILSGEDAIAAFEDEFCKRLIGLPDNDAYFAKYIVYICLGLCGGFTDGDSDQVKIARNVSMARCRLMEITAIARRIGGDIQESALRLTRIESDNIDMIFHGTGGIRHHIDDTVLHTAKKTILRCSGSVLSAAQAALDAVNSALDQIDVIIGTTTTGDEISTELHYEARPFALETGRAPYADGAGLNLYQIPRTQAPGYDIVNSLRYQFDALVITGDAQNDYGMVVRGSPNQTDWNKLAWLRDGRSLCPVEFKDSRFPTSLRLQPLSAGVLACDAISRKRSPPEIAIGDALAIRDTMASDSTAIDKLYRDVDACLDNYRKCNVVIIRRSDRDDADPLRIVRAFIRVVGCSFAIITANRQNARSASSYYMCMLNASIPRLAQPLVVSTMTLSTSELAAGRRYRTLHRDMLTNTTSLVSIVAAWACINERRTFTRGFYAFILAVKHRSSDTLERPTKYATLCAHSGAAVATAQSETSQGGDSLKGEATHPAGRTKRRRAPDAPVVFLPPLPMDILKNIYYQEVDTYTEQNKQHHSAEEFNSFTHEFDRRTSPYYNKHDDDILHDSIIRASAIATLPAWMDKYISICAPSSPDPHQDDTGASAI